MGLVKSLMVCALCAASPVQAGPAPFGTPPLIDPFVRVQASQAGFEDWVAGFRTRALDAGISAANFDRAFDGVRFDPSLIELDRNQNEFSKTLWDYLDTAVSDARILNGRSAYDRRETLLTGLEAQYGVDAHIITAIWGLESAYGAVRGSNNTIQALSTLAYDGRRGAFFEGELLAALVILQNEGNAPRDMVGSWAGAMGHTQFMPTSFLEFAVDGDGDTFRNIWGDDPTDALASTANYLNEQGWVEGQPWGVEVLLPDNFDYLWADRANTLLPSAWAGVGVTDLNGNAVPDHGEASILLPAGHEGPAFMIFDNFAVLETYNSADAYVIGVGHLADRIAGGDPVQSTWPRADRALTGAERRELQQNLLDAGFDPQAIDGLIGPLTINAIRAYQQANGLVPDGYASPQLFERLR